MNMQANEGIVGNGMRRRAASYILAVTVLGSLAALTAQAQAVGPEFSLVGPAWEGTQGGYGKPSAAFDGVNYLTGWEDTRTVIEFFNVNVTRVASDGTVLDPNGIDINYSAQYYNAQLEPCGPDNSFPAIACGGGRCVAAYAAENSHGCWGTSNVGWTVVSPDGKVASGGLGANPHDGLGVSCDGFVFGMDIAWNGTEYLLVWVESNFSWDQFRVRAQRIDANGDAIPDGWLYGSPFPITNFSATIWDGYPAVAWDGTNFVVAWGTSGGIRAARVAPDGTVLDYGGFMVSDGNAGDPDIAFNGTHSLLVWEDYRNGNWDLYGGRLTPSGTLLEPPVYGKSKGNTVLLDPGGFAVSTVVGNQWYPSVATNGTDFFAVWQDYRNGPGDDIYGARITSAAALLDGPPATGGMVIQQSPLGEYLPAATYSTGGKYLISYYSWDSVLVQGIANARLFYDGLVGSSVEISPPGAKAPLSTTANADGTVTLAWQNLNDISKKYSVYEGRLDAAFYSHVSLLCHTAGEDAGGGTLRATVLPLYDNSYFLVTASDEVLEGPAGYDSAGAERSPALNTCGPHP